MRASASVGALFSAEKAESPKSNDEEHHKKQKDQDGNTPAHHVLHHQSPGAVSFWHWLDFLRSGCQQVAYH
jgi:hypothetical protein